MPDRFGDIDFVPVTDALAREASWLHEHRTRILGIPVVCRSNSRYVCERFAEAFAICQDDVDDGTSPPELSVRVAIVPWPEHPVPPPPVRAFAPDAARLLLHSPATAGTVDPDRREAIAFASAAFAADPDGLTRQLLETMTFALIAHVDRHPLHASAIVHERRAVLLAGPSGAGKSTLAHVADAAGLHVLSEGTGWIQQQPRLRVWGLPRGVHLRSGAGLGKSSLPLTMPAAERPRSADSATVCLLEPGHPTAHLEPLDADAVARALTQVESGFDRFPDRHRAVVSRLSEGGGWRLRLTGDASDALPFIKRILDVAP
jgi:hypothetical protein